MVAEGRLPVLGDLLEGGVAGPLESQVPPWTPSAWPSLYTGVNPGKHGVFDFLTFDGYDWDVVNRTHVREHALWELLSERGRSSVVVNVPVTSPPREFDGALVPGYVAPESPSCHPEGLLEELDAELGEYRVYAPSDASGDDEIEWYRRLTRMRGEAFRYLVEEFDPEFGFVQFQQTDSVFHEQDGDPEAVRAVYEAVDEQIGQILDAHDPETVIVASDHGIGEYTGYEFRVNEFLRERGYVETEGGRGGMPTWGNVDPATIGSDHGDESTLSERLLRTAAGFGLTSQRIGAVVDRLGLTDLVLDHVSSDAVRAATESVDFEQSTAYVRSRTELGVRINLEGREPAGVVPPDQYEAVREELIDELAAAQTPEGDPVFEAVGPREEYFQGPCVEDAVDIVTVPAGFDHHLSSLLSGGQFGPVPQPWNHKRDGLFVAHGPTVDQRATLDGAHLFDVAPTVLSSLGVPPSDTMDGEPLRVVDSCPPDEYPTFDASTTTNTADEGVERRLAALGYLDDNEH
ncbi:alkaline phosphatase family protein [Halobacterium wangiae]|uniref:alkaline phosphatase family protein n=1 Tax=Halobacterium wangiae TaxID=2902623 RepID=UPI001E517508